LDKNVKKMTLHLRVMVFFAMTSFFVMVNGTFAGSALDEAKHFVVSGNPDSAILALSKVIPNLENKENLAKAYLIRGEAHYLRKEITETKNDFRKAIISFPSIRIDGEQVDKNLLQLFAHEKKQTLGSALFITRPKGAEITVDGIVLGNSPLALRDIGTGIHNVKFSLAGYLDVVKEIKIIPYKPVEVFGEMLPNDQIPPVIVAPTNENIRARVSYRLQVNVKDNDGVKEVIVNYKIGKASKYKPRVMKQVGTNIYETIFNGDMPVGEKFSYYIKATDFSNNKSTAGNINHPLVNSIVFADSELPKITHTPMDSTSDASILDIKAEVTDNDELSEIRLAYRRGGSAKYIVEKMKQDVDDIYHLRIPKRLMKYDSLEYYIEAKDISGNIGYFGEPSNPVEVKIYSVKPFFEGVVINRKNKRGKPSKMAIINLGVKKGVQNGDIFTVFGLGDKVIDPITGEVYRVEEVMLGNAKVIKAGVRTSIVAISNENKKVGIKVNDFVRSKPGAVYGLSAVSQKMGEIKLSWNSNLQGETGGYLVYRSGSLDDPFEEITRIKSGKKTAYTDKGGRKLRLEPKKPYYYKVAAFNKSGAVGKFSKPLKVLAKGGVNPPDYFYAESGQIKKIPFKWSLPRERGLKGFIIKRADEAEGVYKEIARLDSPKTANLIYRGSGLSPLGDGETAFYRIYSINKKGEEGNPSASVKAVTKEKPAVPTSMQLLEKGIKHFTFQWDAHPNPSVIGYHLYRSNLPDGERKLAGTVSYRYRPEFVDDGDLLPIEDGETYYYSLTAFVEGGLESGYSNTLIATAKVPPLPPQNLKAQSHLLNKVLLKWEPLENSAVGYIIYRGENRKDLTQLKRIRGIGSREYTDRGLESGKLYFYKLVSYDVVGTRSVGGKIVKAVTQAKPKAIKGFNATSGGVREAVLSWYFGGEKNIGQYLISRSESAESGFEVVGSVGGDKNSFKDIFLKDNQKYYYTVSAVSEGGLESEKSDVIFIMTKAKPEPPLKLEAEVHTRSVVLKWEKSFTEGVKSYNVYKKGLFSSSLAGTTQEPTITIKKLKPNSSLSFTVTAIGSGGLESEPSSALQIKTLKPKRKR